MLLHHTELFKLYAFVLLLQWSTPIRGSQMAVSPAVVGEGDAASDAGSSESSEPAASVTGVPVAAPPANVSPGVKLVIGDDEETMKSVSRSNLLLHGNTDDCLGKGVVLLFCRNIGTYKSVYHTILSTLFCATDVL